MAHVLFICGDHPRNLYLMHSVFREYGLVGLVLENREEFIPSPDLQWSHENQENFIRHFASREVSEKRFFDGDYNIDDNDCPTLHVNSKTLNSEKTIRFISEINPDIVVLYGASIINRPLLNSLPKYTINLHSGLVPRYKGHASTFWSFYFLEPNWAGGTYHIVSEKLDSGDIIHQMVPELEYGDTLHDVACKVTMIAANDILKIIDYYDRHHNISSCSQPSSGRLFVSKDFNPDLLKVIYEYYDDKIVDYYLDGKITPRQVKLLTLY